MFTNLDFMAEYEARGGSEHFPFVATYYPTREEWLAARTATIGASDAGVVMGLSRYKTRTQLFNEKTGRVKEKEFKSSPFIEIGNASEPHIRELFAIEHPSLQVFDGTGIILRSARHPHLHATLDMILFDPQTNNWGVGEIKTGTKYDKKWHSEYCPDSYFVQVCHQLAVTGFDFAILVARLRGSELTEPSRERKFVYSRSDAEMYHQIEGVAKECESFAHDIETGVLTMKMAL